MTEHLGNETISKLSLLARIGIVAPTVVPWLKKVGALIDMGINISANHSDPELSGAKLGRYLNLFSYLYFYQIALIKPFLYDDRRKDIEIIMPGEE